MTIYKCKGCDKGFSTERGLSSHFQHKNICKSIHYGIACYVEDVHLPYQTNKTENKIKLSTVKTSKLLFNNIEINDINNSDNNACNNDIELINTSLSMESEIKIKNEFEMEFDKVDINEYDCNFINDNENNNFLFHNDNRVENNLLKLILEIGAPNYAFKKILNWAKDAYSTGYQFNPRSTSYKSQIKMIEKHSN